MKKILTSLLIISTLVSQANAQNAYPLRKGESAPTDGVLLVPQEANRLRTMDIEQGYFKEQNEILYKIRDKDKEQMDIMQQRIDGFQKRNEDLANRIEKLSGDNFWQNTIWFVLGVGATIGVGYAATQAWR